MNTLYAEQAQQSVLVDKSQIHKWYNECEDVFHDMDFDFDFDDLEIELENHHRDGSSSDY